MENFTLSELGLFVATLSGAIVSLIFALQKSKCETINCCGILCKRKIEPPANPRANPPVNPPVDPPVDPPAQA